VLTSVREVGIIEHLVVYLLETGAGKVHAFGRAPAAGRAQIVGRKSVRCLLATDDEGFTYNHKISRLAPIQEHFMLLKAVEKGVSEERIAKALDVDVSQIRRKRNLLNGIDGEAVDMLKGTNASAPPPYAPEPRGPERQIEMCELMIAAHNYTVPFAKALLAATPSSQLRESKKKKKVEGLSRRKWPAWRRKPRGWPVTISSWSRSPTARIR
jgi:hypothetical protein